MLKTELNLPFVWYNDIDKQYRYRAQNLSKLPFLLICGNTSFLPFQIKKAFVSNTESITEWKLYNLDGTLALDLSAFINLVEIRHTLTDEYLLYKGNAITGLLSGCYYMKIVKGTYTFYSETFKIIPDAELINYIKLEWWNGCDISPILYSTGFKNKIYLDTYTEVIPAEITEEGEENGNEVFLPTFQRVLQKHKIEFFGPDYLLDSIVLASIHDNIWITEGNDVVQINSLKVTNDYGEHYCGNSKVEFALPGDYIRTACCSNVSLEKFYLKLSQSTGVSGADMDVFENMKYTNITVECFADAAGTIPLPIFNFNFNIQKQRQNYFIPVPGSPYGTSDPIQLIPVTQNGSSTVVLTNTELSGDVIAYTGTAPNDWHDSVWIYFIEPSVFYIVI